METLELDPRTCAVPMNREHLLGKCGSADDKVRLKALLEADIGARDMGGMANLYCMFGKP